MFFRFKNTSLVKKGFRLVVVGCAPAGLPVSVARSPVPDPGGIRRPASRLPGLGVCSGPGARVPGVPVHINKLITYCFYYIVHKNEPIFGISFVFLYNGFNAYFVPV